ncbi:glycerophosphoryl diester phosphodiesterase membrane domain-containing protein [Microcoleus sp. Pol7_A1]|uniref:glycerophosphoryl diester phosphodiesterase membrane domain-containing protein n=1 Tax=Microcoleus sp. Pol7_A1 TaxID=2818893 RepID=UPI002FD3DFBA
MPKKNLSSSGQTGPLSVGNVVSASLRIYRDHFKPYFGLAFVAYLWLLVPIYGWAKYSAISALISRLAFGEVREKPETVSDARREVNPRMWGLFWAGTLTFLIFFGVSLVGGIAMAILAGGAAAIFGQNYAILAAFLVVAVIAFFIIYIRIFSRLLIVELPLALENNIGASSAISRSWQLTKGSVGRIQWIVFVGILVSLPMTIVVQILTVIVQVVSSAVLGRESGLFYLVYYILIVVLSIVSGALVTPFWQAMKAIIYYDLRSRKEGLGLKMRDR